MSTQAYQGVLLWTLKEFPIFYVTSKQLDDLCCEFIGVSTSKFCTTTKDSCNVEKHGVNKCVPIANNYCACTNQLCASAWTSVSVTKKHLSVQNPGLIDNQDSLKDLSSWKALFSSINDSGSDMEWQDLEKTQSRFN